uniref:Uncharacterized protein n=1 Tax=Arundo donax TaxID=35708 RepID=A0A0A9DH38_ARUDO
MISNTCNYFEPNKSFHLTISPCGLHVHKHYRAEQPSKKKMV